MATSTKRGPSRTATPEAFATDREIAAAIARSESLELFSRAELLAMFESFDSDAEDRYALTEAGKSAAGHNPHSKPDRCRECGRLVHLPRVQCGVEGYVSRKGVTRA